MTTRLACARPRTPLFAALGITFYRPERVDALIALAAMSFGITLHMGLATLLGVVASFPSAVAAAGAWLCAAALGAMGVNPSVSRRHALVAAAVLACATVLFAAAGALLV